MKRRENKRGGGEAKKKKQKKNKTKTKQQQQQKKKTTKTNISFQCSSIIQSSTRSLFPRITRRRVPFLVVQRF